MEKKCYLCIRKRKGNDPLTKGHKIHKIMDTTITITVSLCDAQEANNRINDNRWLHNQLQQTATNQWESNESYDTDDEDEGDKLYELKETITETLAGLEYEILNNGEF